MPDSDDEDGGQTTLQPDFEDEASTTIEQEKAKQLGLIKPLPITKQAPALKPAPRPVHNTSMTNTGTGAGLEEHTVDDQRAREVLSSLTPLRPDTAARLMITQGNDAGQEIDIRPGKSYTIGRAIDNDCVLTDISVSRKHFDLKFDDGTWVIVDRGSGNGTVVNGNLEDNPFVLAHGDVIEIGNTMFRFDQPNGPQRASIETFDVEDEEMSTVAGKQMRDDLRDGPPRREPLDDAHVLTRPRPKTMPPPAPTPHRPLSPSGPPPLAYPTPMQANAQLSPASTLPMAQMSNRAPLAAPLIGPGAPTMIGDQMGLPRHNHVPILPMTPTGLPMSPNGMPMTLQGPAPASRPSFPYPQAHEIPPHSAHAHVLQIQAANRRADLSTAHVSPVPYNGMLPAPQYDEPRLSRRTKLVLAGVGLAVLTGIITAAVIKSSSDKPKPVASAKGSGSGTTTPEPKANAPKADAGKPVPTVPAAGPNASTVPKPQTPTDGSAADPTTTPTTDSARVTSKEGVKDITAPVKIDKGTEASTAKAEPKVEAKVLPKVEAKVLPKVEAKAQPKRESRRDPEPRRETPKRVAAADASSALDKAEDLYRDKKFNDASSILAAAAKSADADEAKQLRYKSDLYAKLGKAYAVGTAPAQKASVAYENLTSALTYDKNLGGEFTDDLESKQAAVASKAAIVYTGTKEWPKARSAYIIATKNGSSDSNLQLVKQKLEAVAGELYNEASKEIGTSPGPAKDKLKQVKALVDSKSPWYAKADALLKKS